MTDLPRQKLIEIIARDRSIIENAKRCEAMLKDLCHNEHKSEIKALCEAIKDGILEDLKNTSSLSVEVLFPRLSKQLSDNSGLRDDLARWAVESWAIALDLSFDVSSLKVESNEPIENSLNDLYYRFEKKNQWGFIDQTGNVVIEPIFQFVRDFNYGLALVKYNDKWGFINRKGVMVIPPTYESAVPFSEGLAAVRIDGKYGFIDTNGKFAIKPKYDCYDPEFINNCALVRIGDRGVLIDKNDRVVTDSKFDVYSHFYEDLALFKSNEKYGFIDKGNNVIIQAQYDNAFIFTEGLCAVLVGDKVGYINNKNHWIIPPTYHYNGYFTPFSEGVAAVSVNDYTHGYIDKSGKMIFEPQMFVRLGEFHCGLAKVGTNGRYGYIDKQGKYVIEPKYLIADDFKNERAYVSIGTEKVVSLIPPDSESWKFILNNKNVHRACPSEGWYRLNDITKSYYIDKCNKVLFCVNSCYECEFDTYTTEIGLPTQGIKPGMLYEEIEKSLQCERCKNTNFYLDDFYEDMEYIFAYLKRMGAYIGITVGVLVYFFGGPSFSVGNIAKLLFGYFLCGLFGALAGFVGGTVSPFVSFAFETILKTPTTHNGMSRLISRMKIMAVLLSSIAALFLSLIVLSKNN